MLYYYQILQIVKGVNNIMKNLKNIIADFPMLLTKPLESKQIIYFDNAATSHKPASVILAITNFYSQNYATVHRGLYEASEFATERYEQVRAMIAKFINAKNESEIIFTKGTTEGINFVAESWANNILKPGDEILLTHVEHHANLLPWQRVASRTGAVLKFITLDLKNFDMHNPESFVSKKTKLMAVTASSNVLGGIWSGSQLKNLISAAHSVGAKVLVDAAQLVAHEKIDIQDLNPDFLVFSGHKIFGPTGVGVLYINKNLHDQVEPYQLGGSMVFDVDFDKAKWAQAPHKFEAGTPPISSVIGLGAAIEYMNEKINFDDMKQHEAGLCKDLVSGLQKIKDVKIIGNVEKICESGHLVSFCVEGVHAHDLASWLGTNGVAVRAGHHCAHPLIKLLKVEALLRVSFAVYNTRQEVEEFLKLLELAIKFFKKL